MAATRQGTVPRLARLFLRLAVVALVVAAARPVLETQPAGGSGILEIVVDVSGSTNADDISPTRIQAMQQGTSGLLDRVPRPSASAW